MLSAPNDGPDPRQDPLATARLIEAVADRVEATMHELRAYDREDVWSGRVAARFGDELTDQLRRTRLAAEELRQQAALLRARANLTATGANG